MRERKWALFPFDSIHFKAAQIWLDKKASDGWVLEHIYLRRIAKFVPAQGRKHFVDLDFNTELHTETGDDYLQLCEDAGWELVRHNPGLNIFRSKLGTHPAPIQSDTAMEAERYWKKCVRKQVLWEVGLLLFFVALFVLLAIKGGFVGISSFLIETSNLLKLLVVLLGLILLVWEGLAVWSNYRHWRKTGELSVHYRRTLARCILSVLLSVLFIGAYIVPFVEIFEPNRTVDVEWSFASKVYTAAPELCQSYPVITAADLGLEYSDYCRYLDGWDYLLADVLEYDEITDGPAGSSHNLTTMRYECINETVAGWMFSARREETARGVDYIWGSIDWGEVICAYGFDRICFARNNSCVILQQGDTVALVEATGFDLTEYTDTLRQRLTPEE